MARPRQFAIGTRRGAYAALVLLTIVWGLNFVGMKIGVQLANAIVFNIERTLAAIVLLFGVMLWEGRPLKPGSWIAVIVTGLCQTTVNFGATTIALAEGGAGRTAFLVFTMPFWTILIAWPVLHERLRSAQWLAVALAMTGFLLILDPWHWQGDVAPKLWATVSGIGWGAGAVATKYYQRRYQLDMISFAAWQMVAGTVPLAVLPLALGLPLPPWSLEYGLTLLYVGVVATGFGFILWTAILKVLPAGTATLNMLAIPVIGLVSSLVTFGEHITGLEWSGIALIGIGLVLLSIYAARTGGEPARASAGDRGRQIS